MKYLKYFESKKDKFPSLKKLEIDGFSVYVGKDAKSNDHLTFNMADDNDIWLHAKGIPGSHAIIKVNDKIPTEYVIRQVGEIVKKNSKSGNNEVKIVYCKRKFVTKESGMKDGQVKVDYNNSNEIVI